MRSELKVPFQLSGGGVQCEHAIRVQIVAGTNLSIEIGTWVAGRPVKSVGFSIVGAWHPRGSTAVLIQISRPALGAGLTRRRNSPETPRQLPGASVVGGYEAAYAVIP